MDFLKRYNPTVMWLDCHVGMHRWVQNSCACKSSPNSVGANAGSSHGTMITCSNRAGCCDYVLVSARQVTKSTKINVVSAHEFVNMVCGDNDAVIWCILVHPVVS